MNGGASLGGDRHRAGRTGKADDRAGRAFEGEAAEDEFKTGRAARIAGDAVGGIERCLIERAGSRDTLAGLAEAAEILKRRRQRCGENLEMRAGFKRAVVLDGDRLAGIDRDRRLTLGDVIEADAVAGLEEGAGLPVDIPHLVRRRADDLPATGACLRIDAAEGAGKRHGTGGNACARALSARHMQGRIAAGEIAEARGKAAEGNGEFAFGMAADHLLDGQAGMACHIGKILAVVMDGDLDELVGWFRLDRKIAPADGGCKLHGADHVRPEPDHHGACGRNRFLDTVDRIGVERGEEGKRLIKIGDLDENGGEADGKKTDHVVTRDRLCLECR